MQPLVIREEPLNSFVHFSRRLAATLAGHEPVPEPELANVLEAECVQCGIRVNGCEIIQVGQAETANEDTSKVGRLRNAYCARKGCKSYFYRLKFYHHPQLDWPNLIKETDATPAQSTPEDLAAQELRKFTKGMKRKQFVARLCAALVIIAGLFMLFQWYNGGTIPFIREPEQLNVGGTPDFHKKADAN